MVIFIDKFHQVARLRSCNFMFWWGLPSLPTKEKENVVMDMEIVQNNGATNFIKLHDSVVAISCFGGGCRHCPLKKRKML